MKYQWIPIRMAKNKKLTIPSFGEDIKKWKLSYIGGGNIKWYNHLEHILAVS